MTYAHRNYRQAFVGLFSLFFAHFLLMSQNTKTVSLNDNWTVIPVSVARTVYPASIYSGLSPAGYAASLPNSALNVLFENKVIPDPFYRDNEAKLKGLENSDWRFEKKFDADAEMMSAHHADLVLHGADTYADVYLNDILLLRTENAFRTWRAPVHNLLKPTNNILRIEFKSPLEKEKILNANSTVDYPAIPNNLRMYTRKPGFHYGWDWGPRFVTVALGDVRIEMWDKFKLEDVNFKTLKLTGAEATVKAEISVLSSVVDSVEMNIRFGEQNVKDKFFLQKGINTFTKEFTLSHPRLWWTHNLGEPYLYDVIVDIFIPFGETVSERRKVGLRTLELIQEKDTEGETFYFKLNGIPVFAKGANLIPLDFFQERVTPAFTEQIIQSAVESNMNMLRVWGGGIYQTDLFYDLCDRKGVLVWQDFMYACAMYPNDASFLANAKAEAVEQVKRLRGHPSLALWCGNNEINEAWHNWGWKPRYLSEQQDFIWAGYENIFKKMLPSVVAELGNGIAYHESSPRYGRYNSKSYREGDAHDWFVWHDERPFEHYEQHIPRFMSEYGFQSLPDWKTIESFTEPGDRTLQSPVMLAHQKHGRGNKLMEKYMRRQYRVPDSFKKFVYVSQLVQAEGIGRAIEAQRRAMPYCMGSLYWQLNDVWPGASWSSMDNTGRWKALQYCARDAYNNLLVSPHVEHDSFKITVVNDAQNNIDVDLVIQVMDFSGKTIFMNGKRAVAPRLTSELFYELPLKTLLTGADKKNCFVLITAITDHQKPIERTYFFVPPKDLNLPKPDTLKQEFNVADGGVMVTLQSSVLLKNICLSAQPEGWFSKNYFDLIPNRSTQILFKTNATLDEVKKSFNYQMLND